MIANESISQFPIHSAIPRDQSAGTNSSFIGAAERISSTKKSAITSHVPDVASAIEDLLEQTTKTVRLLVKTIQKLLQLVLYLTSGQK
ncbi:hypothetical protein CSA_004470, partial [Cucumis sativus]